MIEGVVEALVESGTDPNNVTVLLSEKYRHQLDELQTQSTEPIHWACHDPDQEEEMAYLATTEEGHAIVLNRILTDADLVIPLGCFRTGTVQGHFGDSHDPFSRPSPTEETLAEFGITKTQDARGRKHKRHVQETDRIGWLLGIIFSIQVIPGRAGQVVGVIAGEVEQVKHEAIRIYRQAWHHQIPAQADLVISILDEQNETTNWASLVQSLIDSIALVGPDGAVVVLSNLSESPGPAVQALIDAQDSEATLREIRESKLEDAQTATRLAELVSQHKIYLMSELDEQTVEDLRMTPIDGESEIIRLSERYRSALVLEGMPFVTAEIIDSTK